MRRGHKARRPQQGLNPLAQGQVVLVLIEQHQLIPDYRAQRQQLRAPQPFHRHLHAPFKDILEQTVERFNSLGPQFMEDPPHLYAVIVVGICPAPGRHQRTVGLLAPLVHRWGMIGGITQDIAHFSGEGSHQPGRNCIVCNIGWGQSCG
jgi:hypothetical protein